MKFFRSRNVNFALKSFECFGRSSACRLLLVQQQNNHSLAGVNTGSPFPVIKNAEVNLSESALQANARASKEREKTYSKLLEVAEAGGGEKAIKRHTQQLKKLLVKDRLKCLLDPDSTFLELSPLAGLGMEYGHVPKAGVVTGIGKVTGKYCMVVANDGSFKGGTVYPITIKKQLRAQEIAHQNRLPCLYLVDSGGAFLPLQSEVFPDKNNGGRAFYNEAVMSAEGIPQIAAVCGSCTAGGAYVPTMADEAVIVHRAGTIFLGGPPLVQAALGEIVSAEELGGATLHCSVSGCTDYFAKTEEECFETCRSIVASLNVPCQDDLPKADCSPPAFDTAELEALIPSDPTAQHSMDVYKVMARIVDGSKFHEFKKLFGPSLVCGFAHIGGCLVGILGNQGEVTETAAVKATHFVQLCSERDVPIIFLQNTAPEADDTHGKGGPAGSRLKAQARLMTAISCAMVPKITIVMGNAIGFQHYLMGGRAVSPNFLFTWPNAITGLMSPTHLATAITQEQSVPGSQEELQGRMARETAALYTTTRALDDGTILPRHTREVLIKCLAISLAYRQPQLGNQPLIRM